MTIQTRISPIAEHALSSYEGFPSRAAARIAENTYSTALAYLHSLSMVDSIRAIIDRVTAADFEGLGAPETQQLDALLDKVLEAAKADRALKGYSL